MNWTSTKFKLFGFGFIKGHYQESKGSLLTFLGARHTQSVYIHAGNHINTKINLKSKFKDLKLS